MPTRLLQRDPGRLRPAIAGALLGLALSHRAVAPDVIYDVADCPAVDRLDEDADSLRAWLRGRYSARAEFSDRFIAMDGRGAWSSSPVLSGDAAYREEVRTRVTCPEGPSVPRSWLRKLFPRTAPARLESGVRACCGSSGRRAFLLVVVDMEDEEREALPSRNLLCRESGGSLEFRSPTALRDVEVLSMAWFEGALWIATARHYPEAIGDGPALGLVRYDWRTGSLHTYVGTWDGPCSFVPRSLLVHDGGLWAGGDLGLSTLDPKTGRWRHYLPDPGADPPLHEVDCRALVRQLREGATPHFRDQLLDALRTLRRPPP